MRKAFTWLVALALFAGAVRLGSLCREQDTAWLSPGSDEGSRMDPALARVASAGHVNSLVDWLWMQVLTDTNIHHVQGTHPRLYHRLQLATDLDPLFYELYPDGATLLAVIRDDGPGARDILEKGAAFARDHLPAYPDEFKMQFWPRPWQLFLYLGYVYIYELDDLTRGGQALTEASRYPGAPSYLSSLARRLSAPDGHYEVAEGLVRFLLDATRDEKLREKYADKLRSLEVSRFIRDLNARYARWSARSGTRARDLKAFLREEGLGEVDPWGGRLTLDSSGRLGTSTPRQKVFGLE
jgi:hypothetical protein